MITLGIIGIVAALTMPALMVNYQKKVLETRIKKFYTVLMQAIAMKKNEDGAIDDTMMTAANNPDKALEFFDKNYAPYIKTTAVEKTAKGLAVALPDGSGMYFRKEGSPSSPSVDFYMHFCVDYKKCKNMNETTNSYKSANSRDNFVLTPYGQLFYYDKSREELKALCTAGRDGGGNQAFYCFKLIQLDGWEIKDDYPY